LTQFSPRDFISLDDYVFNTEAHPFLIPQPKSSPRREPLWSGPEAELESEGFVEQIGEGTWVQKWARVIQASKLAKGFRDEAKKKSKGWFGGLVGKGKKGGKEKGFERIAVKEEKGGDEPVAVRKPIRPSEEELEQAKKGQGRDGGGGRGGYKGEAWMAQGGGGKGMGGGAPPPS
jgi:mannosyl-oligosaccharide alpha-1,2-mannosidase